MSIFDELKRPFPPDAIKFRVGSRRGQYWSILSYLDARMVSDRLNMLGVRWEMKHSDLQVVPIKERVKDGLEIPRLRASVQCDLAIEINGKLVMRSDVGEEIGDEDDLKLVKTVYSDSFKRAAVHFGVGEYLYGLDMGIIPNSDVEYGRINEAASKKLQAKYAKLIDVPVEAAEKPVKATKRKTKDKVSDTPAPVVGEQQSDPELDSAMDSQDANIIRAVGELAALTGGDRQAGIKWAKGSKDKSGALNTAIRNAAGKGVDRSEIIKALADPLALFIETFDATEAVV